MRTHTTTTLRNLIINDMDPAKYTMSRLEIDGWIRKFPKIVKDMSEKMDMMTFLLSVKKAALKPMGQIQRECVGLLDSIEKLPILPSGMLKLYDAAIVCVENILNELETIHSGYMDWEFRMPQILLRREAVEVCKNMEVIKTGFKKCKIDSELQTAACHCMQEVIRLKRVSYRRMRFVQRLQMMLMELVEGKTSIDNWDVCNVLYRENYNYRGFMIYYQSLIKADLKEMGTSIHFHDIQRYLNSFEKPTYCKKATQYDMDARKCHQVMYEFVMEELR